MIINRVFFSIIKEKFKRVINNIHATHFFLRHHSGLIKPLHCQNVKPETIRLGTGIRIDQGARIDIYKFDTSMGVLDIKDNVHASFNLFIICSKSVTIGKNCLFGSNVLVTDTNHGMNLVLGCFSKQKNCVKNVSIGDNCWLGDKVVVLPGVHIGNNVVVGAGSVVTKDIPENSVAVGNPAKVIKRYDKLSNKWERV